MENLQSTGQWVCELLEDPAISLGKMLTKKMAENGKSPTKTYELWGMSKTKVVAGQEE